jgi:hypothetical protein
MTWFRIRIEGGLVREKIVTHQQILWGLFTFKRPLGIAGFYATRYIEAEDGDAAIEAVCSGVKRELSEALPAVPSWDSLVLKVDWIETLDFKDVDVNAKGFTFFDKDE